MYDMLCSTHQPREVEELIGLPPHGHGEGEVELVEGGAERFPAVVMWLVRLG